MRRASTLLIVTAMTLAAQAHAGKPHNLPRWCGSVDGSSESSAGSIDDDAKDTGYGNDKVARDIARGSCEWRSSDDDTKKHLANAAAGRERFKVQTGLTDAELDDLFAIEVDKNTADSAGEAFCKSTRVDDSATLHEQSMSHARSYLACPDDHGNPGNYDWVDASQFELIAQARSCMASLESAKNLANTPSFIVRFAACDSLIPRIDRKKLTTEMGAKSYSRYAALWTLARLNETLAQAKRVETMYQTVAGKDPINQTAAFDAPRKASADFQTLYAAHPQALDGVSTMMPLAKTPRKIKGGCSETYQPLLAKGLAAAHPANADAALDAVRQPLNLFLVMGFALCEAADGHQLIADTFAKNASGAPVGMGPEAAAAAASYLSFVAEIKDPRDVRNITAPSLGPSGVPAQVSNTIEVESTIASVVPASDGQVKVSFKQETWQEPTMSCHEGRKIDGIDATGHLHYRQECKVLGQHTVVHKETPILVDARLARPLKPGRFVVLRTSGRNEPRTAVPNTVWTGKDKKILVGYLGLGW